MDDIAWVLPNKLGGVFTYVRTVLTHGADSRFSRTVVRTDGSLDLDARTTDPLPADREHYFRHSLPLENVYSVLRRLRRTLGRGPGVIVANDWLELALTSVHDTGRAVIAVAHTDHDYYYNLATTHASTIDAHVAVSTRVFNRLRDLLPERRDSIFLLPSGVDLPAEARRPVPGPLRLLFVGRLDGQQKGVFDLPLIDRRLREAGVHAAWTILGDGPDGAALKAAWSDRVDVQWRGRQPLEEVLRLYREHDVLVMPSRYEGLPISLLEAGAAGVVPVVSNLLSGIPDIVEAGTTGFRPEAADIAGFAQAIASLDRDRGNLERLSANIRRHIGERYDATRCSGAYRDLFISWRQWKRPRPAYVAWENGNRLDKPWLPNSVVRTVRTTERWLRRGDR